MQPNTEIGWIIINANESEVSSNSINTAIAASSNSSITAIAASNNSITDMTACLPACQLDFLPASDLPACLLDLSSSMRLPQSWKYCSAGPAGAGQ